MPSFDQEWKQQQVDAIADALQELLQGDNGEEEAYQAVLAAIDSWLSYFSKEEDKWFRLRQRLEKAG